MTTRFEDRSSPIHSKFKLNSVITLKLCGSRQTSRKWHASTCRKVFEIWTLKQFSKFTNANVITVHYPRSTQCNVRISWAYRQLLTGRRQYIALKFHFDWFQESPRVPRIVPTAAHHHRTRPFRRTGPNWTRETHLLPAHSAAEIQTLQHGMYH